MPLYSDHISNMYYGASPSYSNAPYSYGSSVSPYGVSYSASYLNPGGTYSNHSSIGGYSRTPLTPRWINSSRTYSPMLGTISERSTSSPVRINSPRRTALSNRTYGTPSYTAKPININTADIDVSRDKYQNKTNNLTSGITKSSSRKASPTNQKKNNPFMPRVEEKPETGVDSSPGLQRTTIKRGRTVVRLHTVKRKDRDSPRKPTIEQQHNNPDSKNETVNEFQNEKKPESTEKKWRDKLADDLVYKEKKEKKTLGEKLVEKFKLKDKDESDNEANSKDLLNSQEFLQLPPQSCNNNHSSSKSPERRCSMELLAEQAILLDTLIRKENLSTAPLDLSKIGSECDNKDSSLEPECSKRRKITLQGNQLITTKSDHSLHEHLNSFKDNKNFVKRRSIKKSSSGGSICRLDSITEFPKETSTGDLPCFDENQNSFKDDKKTIKPKPKLKTKITSSVEISPTSSPLKFRIENVTVDEKPKVKPKKAIIFTSAVDVTPEPTDSQAKTGHRKSFKAKRKSKVPTKTEEEILSPEPEDGNFWNKIGKRETVYLMKRKKILEESKQKNLRGLLWFEEEDEPNTTTELVTSNQIFEENSKSTNCTPNQSNENQTSEPIDLKEEITTNLLNKDDNTTIEPKKEILSINLSEQNKNTEIGKPTPTFEIVNSLKQETKDITVPECEIKSNEALSKDMRDTENDVENKITEMTFKKVTLPEQNQVDLDPKIIDDPHNNVKNPSILEKDCSLNKISSNEINVILPVKEVEPITDKSDLGHTAEKDNDEIKQNSTENKASGSHEEKIFNSYNLINKVNFSEDIKDDASFIKPEQSNEDTMDSQISFSTRDSDNMPMVCNIDDRDIGKNIQENSQDTTFEKEPSKIRERKVVTFLDSITDVTPKEIVPNKEDETTISENDQGLTQSNTNFMEVQKSDSDLITSEHKTDSIGCNQNPQLSDSTVNIPTHVNKNESNEGGNSLKKIPTKLSKTQTLTNVKGKIVIDSINSTQPTACQNTEGQSLTKIQKPVKKSPIKKKFDKKVSNKKEDKSKAEDVKKTNNITVTPMDTSKDTKIENIPSISGEESSLLKNKTTEVPSNSGEESSLVNSKTTEDDNDEINRNKTPIETKAGLLKNKTIEVTSNSGEESSLVKNKTTEDNKAEVDTKKNEIPIDTKAGLCDVLPTTTKKPVKQQMASKVLIATPRPLQKRKPQVIRSASSSETSSEEDSSDEEETEESESSESSAEFFECENNGDGRTSTGSNDSGFDSSAPTSPAGFVFVKKDCDVNCHRKCEKLTANLCGVNQRLLVEALPYLNTVRRGGDSPSTSAVSPPNSTEAADFLEQELEQSTAYGLFRKTGRFTPPARSIPRFRKYTIEDFQFIKVLGKGSFGKVLLAELRDTEYYYAVKCLKKDVVLEDDDVECTLIERKVLALGTNHPYLCHLFATFQTDSHLFFVMEYLNGGDLMFHIQQSGRFPEERARFYAAEIVSGLKFLHKRGIVYRDLKLDNILLDFDGHVRIADFGMCKLQIYLDKTADTFCGTPDYMAPEIVKGLKYNQTVDWWSFGVLLYEMLIGQSPFSGCDEDELFWSICNEMPSYPRFLSKDSLSILTRLLDKDARTRLGGTECMHGDIRDQDFFHHIHWDRLERRELEAPFKPRVRHPLDTQYFDRAFTGERPRLTAVEPQVLRSMDQEPFRGFSYTNPNATDR